MMLAFLVSNTNVQTPFIKQNNFCYNLRYVTTTIHHYNFINIDMLWPIGFNGPKSACIKKIRCINFLPKKHKYSYVCFLPRYLQ